MISDGVIAARLSGYMVLLFRGDYKFKGSKCGGRGKIFISKPQTMEISDALGAVIG